MPTDKRRARRLIERVYGLDERVTDLEQDRPGEAPTRRVERVTEQIALADAVSATAKTGADTLLHYDAPARGYDRTQYAPETVSPLSTTTIDDYEDQSLTEYPTGDTSNWAFISTTGVTEGSYALEYVGGNQYGHLLSMPGDGLGDYPGASKRFRADVTLQDTQNQLVIAWCAQSTDWVPASYAVRVDGPDLAFRLEKSTGSGFVAQDSGYPDSYTAGETLGIDVTHSTGGRITASLLNETGTEIASASFVDMDSYTSGGFAVEGISGASDADGPILDYPRTL